MKTKKENELKVICELQDPKIYKYPMSVKYEPEFFIVDTYAKEYITAYQAIFTKYLKLSLEEKLKPIEEDLNIMINKFRKEEKIFLREEIDLTPHGKFPQRLINNQIAILPRMVLNQIKTIHEIPDNNRNLKIEKKVNIKKGCSKC